MLDHLETHWAAPGCNKHETSMICGKKFIELLQ
jgi:hypothetical protein